MKNKLAVRVNGQQFNWDMVEKFNAGFRPRATRHFCFGKSAQNQCAEHVQQLEGASPFDNLMEVKS